MLQLRHLWTNWSGGKTSDQDPLYPYLAGLTYALAGPDPRWVFLWRILVCVGTNVLLFLIAKRCFGPTVGGVTGPRKLNGSVLLWRRESTGYPRLRAARLGAPCRSQDSVVDRAQTEPPA